MKIVTEFVYPPIPVRSFDWSAVSDSYDGAPDAGWQCTGSGRTEFQAVLEFYENWEAMDDVIPGVGVLCAHRPMFEIDFDQGEFDDWG